MSKPFLKLHTQNGDLVEVADNEAVHCVLVSSVLESSAWKYRHQTGPYYDKVKATVALPRSLAADEIFIDNLIEAIRDLHDFALEDLANKPFYRKSDPWDHVKHQYSNIVEKMKGTS